MNIFDIYADVDAISMTPGRNTRSYTLRSVPSSPGRSFLSLLLSLLNAPYNSTLQVIRLHLLAPSGALFAMMRINRSATIFNFHSAQLSRCKSQLYWIIGTKSSSHISGSQWERTIIVISLSVSAFCIFDTFQKDCTYSSFHFDIQLTYPFLCIQLSNVHSRVMSLF